MSSSKQVDDEARALASVRRYLRTGVRSTQDVSTYLRRRGISAEATQQVVSEARARGWLDDRACARLWAEHWARQGYAWSAILEKLLAKGLERRVIDEAARDVGASTNDATRARAVAAATTRRIRSTSRPIHQQRARLARALAVRGFDSDIIEQVLSESLGFTPSDAER